MRCNKIWRRNQHKTFVTELVSKKEQDNKIFCANIL